MGRSARLTRPQVAHSIAVKLMKFGLGGTASFFVGVGLPGWLVYVTFVAEAVGGVLLIFGAQTRWVALALSPALLGAIIWVHAEMAGFSPHRKGAGSIPAFLLVAGVVQFPLGDGAYALAPSKPSGLVAEARSA
jgi:putative oxidoreductase